MTELPARSLMVCPSKRLEGNWGIADVRDSVIAVQQLAAPPYSLIDPQRTAITGGSAGGYTVLKTLCSAPEAFAAGTSSFGISDFFKLAEFTHKFESQYLFKLIGGRPEEIPEVYRERSPVFLADKIRAPLLVCCPVLFCRAVPVDAVLTSTLLGAVGRSCKVLRIRSCLLTRRKLS